MGAARDAALSQQRQQRQQRNAAQQEPESTSREPVRAHCRLCKHLKELPISRVEPRDTRCALDLRRALAHSHSSATRQQQWMQAGGLGPTCCCGDSALAGLQRSMKPGERCRVRLQAAAALATAPGPVQRI